MKGGIAQLRQLAKQRGVDLAKEKLDMENQGFHPSGGGGGKLKSERAQKLESEGKEVEAEIARLRRQLQEEEGKVKLLEEQIRQKSFQPGADGDGQKRMGAFCSEQTEQLAEMKFRCKLCMKLFRGEAFVHKHIQERHFSDMLASLDRAGAATGGGGEGGEAEASRVG
mmetsp:Transcript_2736/g.6924  ORF Transcript_2736/g.6924 Transcript_2736/m.6924 type:complete len:168 (+) Transcript_2736:2-505(+)